MGALDNINTILTQFQTHAATIGITVAGLMIGIYAMIIMFSTDNSAMANRNRWEGLQKVLICAGIIAGTAAFVQFAQNIGHMV